MKNRWTLREARNRLSFVVEQAATAGPQTIMAPGREEVVLLAAEEYRRLTRPSTALADFFRQSPLYGVDIDVERASDTGRAI